MAGSSMIKIERRVAVNRADSWSWPGDLHPVLRQVLDRRSLDSPGELDLQLKSIVPVGHFDDLTPAVELLLAHRDASIVIVGDFDADGATSTALMLLTLKDLGFNRVDFRIPDRFREGYGLSAALVEGLDAATTNLIVTVDNGISSHDGVALARARGIDVLITDHHLPPDVLPDANAIVNPNLAASSFPCKSLAGVGVAFYLLAALGKALESPSVVSRYLDLVALGTVADLVQLDQSNRILVDQGIRRIRAGQCRPGISSLLKQAGTEPASVTTMTLGYRLGPRLNAAGRLDDMSVGVRCLVSDSDAEAKSLAGTLDSLNRSRQDIEAGMKAEALEIVDALEISGSTLPAAICLRRNDWHEGLVGLVASRVKERYHRPCFAFTSTEAGDLKGSGRSIPGFHLRDALAELDAKNPGLISRFGGHAMAAGLSLDPESFEQFVDAMSQIATARIDAETLEKKIMTDGRLRADYMSLEVAKLLRDAVPWGQGFPEPCFDDRFELLETRTLKDAHLKLKLVPVTSKDRGDAVTSKDGSDGVTFQDEADVDSFANGLGSAGAVDKGSTAIDAIAFHQADQNWPVGAIRRIAYRLSVNDYFANESVQLIVEHIENEPA